MRAAAAELLFEHVLELLAGQRHGHQAVTEGLHGEGFAVGDVAVAFVGRARRVGEAGAAHTARIHQGDHGVAETGLAGGGELRVGDDEAGRLAAGGVGDVGQRAGDRADDAFGERRGDALVTGDQIVERGVRRDRGVVAEDDGVPRRNGKRVARLAVDRDVDFGEHAAEGQRAGHRHQLAGFGRQLAVVHVVRVAGDHQVDCRIEALDDIDDVAGKARAVVVAGDRRGRRALAAALMDRDDDDFSALVADLADQRVGGIGFILECQAFDAARCDDGRRAFENEADESDARAVDDLDLVGGEERLLAGDVDHIGREELELRALEGVRCADHIALAGMVVVGRMAAAVLHAVQLGLAFVELVVADRIVIEAVAGAEAVHRLDRAFVVEEGGNQRAGADQVAGGNDHGAVRVLGAHRVDVAGEVVNAADRRAEQIARRAQGAVEIVEADHLDALVALDVVGRGLGTDFVFLGIVQVAGRDGVDDAVDVRQPGGLVGVNAFFEDQVVERAIAAAATVSIEVGHGGRQVADGHVRLGVGNGAGRGLGAAGGEGEADERGNEGKFHGDLPGESDVTGQMAAGNRTEHAEAGEQHGPGLGFRHCCDRHHAVAAAFRRQRGEAGDRVAAGGEVPAALAEAAVGGHGGEVENRLFARAQGQRCRSQAQRKTVGENLETVAAEADIHGAQYARLGQRESEVGIKRAQIVERRIGAVEIEFEPAAVGGSGYGVGVERKGGDYSGEQGADGFHGDSGRLVGQQAGLCQREPTLKVARENHSAGGLVRLSHGVVGGMAKHRVSPFGSRWPAAGVILLSHRAITILRFVAIPR